MSEYTGRGPAIFVQTKGYRLFTDLCDACRRSRHIGLGYGPPGTGKTESARYYAQWDHVESLLPEPLITCSGRSAVDDFYPYKPFTFSSAPQTAPILDCRTVLYTPPVSASAGRIKRQVLSLFAAFSYLIEAANQRHQGKENFPSTRLSSPGMGLLSAIKATPFRVHGLGQMRETMGNAWLALI